MRIDVGTVEGVVAAHLVRPRRRAEALPPQGGADAGV
jgi:hypothetical protein